MDLFAIGMLFFVAGLADHAPVAMVAGAVIAGCGLSLDLLR